MVRALLSSYAAGFLIAVVAVFTYVAPAEAELRPVGLDANGAAISDYNAVGARHIAVLARGGDSFVWESSDGGRSFAPLVVDPALGRPQRASVEPDGRRWLVTYDSTGAHLLTAVEGGPWVVVRSFPNAQVTAPILIAAGRVFAIGVPVSPGAMNITVHRIGADGSDLEIAEVQTDTSSTLKLTPDVQGAWLRNGSNTWKIDPAGHPTPATAWLPDLGPLGADVRMLVTTVVGGASDPPRLLYRAKTAEIMWPITDPLPRFLTDMFPVDGGMLLRGTGNGGAIIAVLSNPQTDGSRGPLAPDTQQLVDATNALRIQQGLPAVIGDPQVSIASRNHAAYDLRWHEAHGETPGREGFTGGGPSERCQAVGTTCSGEIMAYTSIAQSVADWWATPLHRFGTGGPGLIAVGGGFASNADGSTAVIDTAPTASPSGSFAVPTAPIGLPRGSWPGPLGFGGETPDPGAPCGISGPYGTAVTAYGYADLATGENWSHGPISLVDETAGGPVAGCGQPDYFLPAASLRSGHVYRASTVYSSTLGATRPFSWSFVPTAQEPGTDSTTQRPGTDSGKNPVVRCLTVRPNAKRVSARYVRHHGLKVKLRSCKVGRVRLQVRRHQRVVGRRDVRLVNRRVRIVRVRARTLRSGKVTIRAVQNGRIATSTVTVRR